MDFKTIILIGSPNPEKGIGMTYDKNNILITPLVHVIDLAIKIIVLTNNENAIDVLDYTFYIHLN